MNTVEKEISNENEQEQQYHPNHERMGAEELKQQESTTSSDDKEFQHSTDIPLSEIEAIIETLDETLKNKYYKLKKENGELEAIFNIGRDCLFQGKKDQAYKFFNRGALLGHNKSEGYYGYILMYVYETEENEKLAVEYFTKASKTIITYPNYYLGKYLYRNKLFKEAIEHFRMGCGNNHHRSQVFLGNLLLTGENIEKDTEQAFELFQKAAESKSRDAEGMLFKMFHEELISPTMDAQKKEEMRNFWCTKYLSKNISKLELVKDPKIVMIGKDEIKAHSQFEQGDEIEEDLSKEVIVRFESTDFILTLKELRSSFVLSCMTSPNWKDYNQMEEERMVIDMRSIQNEILNDCSTNVESTFHNYAEYLRTNEYPKNFDDKIDVILLADYLLDEKCIRGIEYSNCLIKFYILSQLGRVDNDHIAKASFFIHSNTMLNCFPEYSEKMFEYLLSESDLGSEEKFKLSSLYLRLFQTFATNPLKFSKFPL